MERVTLRLINTRLISLEHGKMRHGKPDRQGNTILYVGDERLGGAGLSVCTFRRVWQYFEDKRQGICNKIIALWNVAHE